MIDSPIGREGRREFRTATSIFERALRLRGFRDRRGRGLRRLDGIDAITPRAVLGFKVHKDGSITDLVVLQPSTIDAFTKSAFNAIKLSNPTVPLPLEYPDENAPFIVTFYFNETPPGGGSQ